MNKLNRREFLKNSIEKILTLSLKSPEEEFAGLITSALFGFEFTPDNTPIILNCLDTAISIQESFELDPKEKVKQLKEHQKIFLETREEALAV